MPSGPQMRSDRNAPSVWPEITSTNRPSTSVERLYSQRVPGWCSSGSSASVADLVLIGLRSRAIRGLGIGLVHRRRAAELIGQAGGVAQQILHGDRPFGRHQLQRAALDHADLAGWRSAGRYLPIGSLSSRRPSSHSIMTPTETIGLVIE